MSSVTHVSAAEPAAALDHFQNRLRFETDCWDTHEALASGQQDFVLLDVRSRALFERSHVPGAVSLPHAKIVEGKLADYDRDTLFVVYCAGPHCNAAQKAAARLAGLGYRVKEMIGGMTGWADEGFAFEQGGRTGHAAGDGE
jgi:rhodanese-related sulfurtransferase